MAGPRPLRFDPSDPGIASAIDEASWWASSFATLLLDRVPMPAGRTVLDLGCGTGCPLLELAQRLGDSCRVVGVDLWLQGLRRAAVKRAVIGVDTAKLVCGDGTRLPFADAAFDVIVSNVGVNNFADAEGALRECRRVIRPGGTLALTTNVRGHMAEFYETFRQVLRTTGRSHLLPALEKQEAHRGTEESLRAMVEAAGFHVTDVAADTLTLRWLDAAALMRHSLTQLGFLEGWRSVVPEAEQEAVFRELEAALDERARAAGELRMEVPMRYLEAVAGPPTNLRGSVPSP